MRAILSYCHLPAETAERCRQTLDHDSQSGTPLCRETLARHPTRRYDRAARKEIDDTCDRLHLPRPDPFYIAPGTITYREPTATG